MKRKIMLLAAAFSLTAVYSQELHESLRVEGQYIPDIVRQDKIHRLPERLTFRTHLSPMPYDLEGTPSVYLSRITALPAVGWRTARRSDSVKGYLDLGAGSFLDVTGSAGYKFVDDGASLLGIMLQHNSTSLFRARNGGNLDDKYRYRYDETLGIYGSYSFGDAGRLSAEASYHLGIFNYYGVTSPVWDAKGYFPKQILNDAYLKAGWESGEKSAVNWRASAYYRYFGYRDSYLADGTEFRGRRESTAGIDGGICYAFEGGSRIGGDISFDYAGYNNPEGREILDGYGNLSLTPHYQLSRGNFSLRAGVRFDFTFNAGPEGDRYGTFHAAPSVNIGWRKGMAGIYLDATGGTEMQTLASLSDLDYYQNPDLGSTLPVYTPVNLKLGVNLGPAAGISGGLHVAYKMSKYTPTGGWYTASLSPAYDRLPAIPGYSYSLLSRGNGLDVKGFSLGADVKVSPFRFLTLKGEVSWQPQNGETGYFNGFDRPRWTADISAEIEPVEAVRIYLGYQYRGVRNIYAKAYADAGTVLPFTPDDKVVGIRLPDITDLNAGVSWEIVKNLTVWGNARNILCRKISSLPLIKEEGFNFQLGFGVLF